MGALKRATDFREPLEIYMKIFYISKLLSLHAIVSLSLSLRVSCSTPYSIEQVTAHTAVPSANNKLREEEDSHRGSTLSVNLECLDSQSSSCRIFMTQRIQTVAVFCSLPFWYIFIACGSSHVERNFSLSTLNRCMSTNMV